ncbi:MAG: hypothetical protein J6K55_09125 [Clostridia bacterium]|nr:hypothetical protein [Clostridia bacterium]
MSKTIASGILYLKARMQQINGNTDLKTGGSNTHLLTNHQRRHKIIDINDWKKVNVLCRAKHLFYFRRKKEK